MLGVSPAGDAETCCCVDEPAGGDGAPSRGREVTTKATIIARMPAAPNNSRAVKGSRSL